MKRLIAAAIGCSLTFLVSTVTYGISAQWDLDPISGDWNTADNWTPNGVPNGPADTATFGLSHTTDISISEHTEVNGITFTPAATNPYSITVNGGLTLTLSGTGITNNSGTTQNFVTEGGGQIYFTNQASAGSSTTFTNSSFTIFLGNSAAGSATFINNIGSTFLEHSSTAGNATFINNGGFQGGYPGTLIFSFAPDALGDATFINNGGPFAGARGGYTEVRGTYVVGHPVFINNGGAADGAFGGQTLVVFTVPDDAVFTNNGGLVSGAFGGSTIVHDGRNATFINNGGKVSGAKGGSTIIDAQPTNGTFINNGATVKGAGAGSTVFKRFASAGSATLIANGGTVAGAEGGTILFADQSTARTAPIEVFGNGSVDISLHDAPGMAINSIAGDGNVFLGANNLTVGSDNVSTTFACAIHDGGQGGGVGGSLTKVGTGTLILSGVNNTYTGNTNVNRGVLQVDGSIASNTFVNRTGTLAGTGTIHGDVTNRRGTVSPGSRVGTLTVDNFTQANYATLMIEIAHTSQFDVLNVLGTANLSGRLDPVLLNDFVPTIGDSFTFLNAGAVNGTLFIFNRNIDNLPEHWEVSYFPTHAVLAVVAGNVAVPDQGSTFLLLTLGLLGLMTYRRQSLRRQS